MSFRAKKAFLCVVLALAALPAARSQSGSPSREGNEFDMRAAAKQILAQANEARAQAGVGPLEWDPALAAAALKHCRRMIAEGPIAHQYAGEPDLGARAEQAGAHFSVIEENVAFGPTPGGIHMQWMNSPGHRENLLSPDVDRVGIAVLPGRGEYYSVADYSRGVESLGLRQVETRVAALVRQSGVEIAGDPSVARAACTTDHGIPRATGGMQPSFVMRWQDADLSQVPHALAERLATGRYREAAVGSCPAQNLGGSFTAYRIAVILY